MPRTLSIGEVAIARSGRWIYKVYIKRTIYGVPFFVKKIILLVLVDKQFEKIR